MAEISERNGRMMQIEIVTLPPPPPPPHLRQDRLGPGTDSRRDGGRSVPKKAKIVLDMTYFRRAASA